MNSKQKGNRGERELAGILRQHGFSDARRGQQFQGSPDSPDVLGLPGHHVECKYVAALQLYEALAQAQKDAGPGDTPLVAHRRVDSHKKLALPWVAILLLDDYLDLVMRLNLAEWRGDCDSE